MAQACFLQNFCSGGSFESRSIFVSVGGGIFAQRNESYQSWTLQGQIIHTLILVGSVTAPLRTANGVVETNFQHDETSNETCHDSARSVEAEDR